MNNVPSRTQLAGPSPVTQLFRTMGRCASGFREDGYLFDPWFQVWIVAWFVAECAIGIDKCLKLYFTGDIFRPVTAAVSIWPPPPLVIAGCPSNAVIRPCARALYLKSPGLGEFWQREQYTKLIRHNPAFFPNPTSAGSSSEGVQCPLQGQGQHP